MSTQPNPAPATDRRPENLALVFQELLTVGERLRSNRQPVSDARSFRAQIWEAVRQAAEEGRRRGYSGEDVELASFGVIAFLDESILNLRSPIFADWPRQPLQEERYGHHIAGEIFFQNLQKLLARSDSQELADLLEIYPICLLLGFAGRYSMGGRGDLRVFVQQTAEKIQRIRHPSLAISPESALPAESAPSLGHDPWVKPILFAAIACFLLVVSSFLVYEFLLQSGASDLRNAAPASQAKLPVNAHGAARIAGRGVIPTSNPAESTAAGESAVRVFLGRIHA